jgi:HK97 family phage prohead protease
MEQLNCSVEIKSITDQGQFQGLASVYGNVDLGGDVVVAGAFQKTLADRGGEVPILWQHDLKSPIGLGKLTDTANGLAIEGQLILADVPKAREAYSLLKAKVLRGLSIGYDSIKSDVKDGIRFLRELKLYEVSLVTVAMNELAQVSAVKANDDNLDQHFRQFEEMLIAARKAWR